VRESAGAFPVPPTPTTLASHTGWVTDITYRWTLEGSLYLAVIVDLFGIVLLKRIAAEEAAVERPVPPLAIVRAIHGPEVGNITQISTPSGFAVATPNPMILRVKMSITTRIQ
jgi:transposase InsO family protein